MTLTQRVHKAIEKTLDKNHKLIHVIYNIDADNNIIGEYTYEYYSDIWEKDEIDAGEFKFNLENI